MAIIGTPLVPPLPVNGQVGDAATLDATINYIVNQVNANAQPIGGAPATLQWQTLNQTPTFISATSFSVPGNLTGTFLPNNAEGLKLQTVNTAGVTYSYVTNASFGGAVTTVTVVNLLGVLDSGLSLVNYGILSPYRLYNAIPQSAMLQVLWAHGTDAISSATGQIVCTNNNFSLVALNYGGSTGLFPTPGEFSTATGQFIPTRAGFYQINQYVQINTTGVTFSGSCLLGPVVGTNVTGPANPDFYANLQANRASAVNSYTDYLINGGAACNLGLRLTFSAGTPVFVQGVLTIIGPL